MVEGRGRMVELKGKEQIKDEKEYMQKKSVLFNNVNDLLFIDQINFNINTQNIIIYQ